MCATAVDISYSPFKSSFGQERQHSPRIPMEKPGLFRVFLLLQHYPIIVFLSSVSPMTSISLHYATGQGHRRHRSSKENAMIYEILDICKSYLTPVSLLLMIASPN